MIVHPLTAHDLARRADLTDRTDIELLVRSFYRYAAMDGLLGPIFSAAHVDWPSHIDTLTEFGPTAEVAKQRAAKMAHALQRLLDDEQHEPSTPVEPLWTTGSTSNAGRWVANVRQGPATGRSGSGDRRGRRPGGSDA